MSCSANVKLAGATVPGEECKEADVHFRCPQALQRPSAVRRPAGGAGISRIHFCLIKEAYKNIASKVSNRESGGCQDV